MGMGINLGNIGRNYSSLFRSTSSGGAGNLNFLSNYASIKNGSYGRLMKAYYAKDSGTAKTTRSQIASMIDQRNKSTISTAKDSTTTLKEIEKSAEGLKKSADNLITQGSKSVFNKVDIKTEDRYGNETTDQGYDKDAIYKAVSGFVKDYNEVLKQSDSSETAGVKNRVKTLVGMTDVNSDLLSKVGITVNKDNTLSIDEKKFKESDMATAKSLFNGNSSYAYRVSAQASLIDFAASMEATKAKTYNMTGNYNRTYSVGSYYDYIF